MALANKFLCNFTARALFYFFSFTLYSQLKFTCRIPMVTNNFNQELYNEK